MLVPQVEVRLRPEAARRSPASRPAQVRRRDGDAAARHEGRRDLRGPEDLRRGRLERAGGARPTSFAIKRLPIDTGGGGYVPLEAVADVTLGADAERDHARGRVAADRRHHATCAGATSARWRATSRRRSANVPFPAGYHPEVLGEYAAREASQNRLLALGAAVAARHPAGAARRLRVGAARGAGRADAAVRADRRRGRGVSLRRRAVAGLAGRLRHRARHRRAQRHHAGEPLPPPARTSKGVPFGPRAGRCAAPRSGSRRS